MQGPPHWNFPPSYNVCPTDPVSVIRPNADGREFVRMRWGLIPRWWSKPLKEMRVATFNARAETVQEKPFFRDAFKRNRCLMPISGYYEWQNTPDGKQPYYFTRCDRQPMTIAAAVAYVARQGREQTDCVVRDGHYRAEQVCL